MSLDHLSPEDRAVVAAAQRRHAERIRPLLEEHVTAAQLWDFLLSAMTQREATVLAAKLQEHRRGSQD